jgi:opacity protein-like surface antigen
MPISSSIVCLHRALKVFLCMNKFIRTAGMLSVGAASLSLQGIATASEGGVKPWSVGASLRGFYDDNIYTRPSGAAKVDSFGFEVSPTLSYAAKFDATSVNLSYAYSAKYYDTSKADNAWDQGHVVNAGLQHAFNERLSLTASDAFAVTREPQELFSGLVFRTQGNNLNNQAQASLSYQISPLWSAVVGYHNGYYNYDNVVYKAALNRIEHLPSLNLRYQIAPLTVGVLGYQYGLVNYDEALFTVAGKGVKRDNASHYFFGGLDHTFSPDLTGAVRAGAQITKYDYNAFGYNQTSPYADANLKYAYAPGSSFQIGVRHQRNATDIDLNFAGNIVQDQESTGVYGVLRHQLTGKLGAHLNAQYQDSKFHGGGATIDGKGETFFTIGGGLDYQISANLSAEASYSYDDLSSNLLSRGYTRNRVFLGIRASY